MPLDAEKYKKLKSLLAGGELSDEVRAQAEAAVAEFDAPFMAEHAAGVSMPTEYTPPSPAEAAKLAGEETASALVRQLDPMLPLQPQVLAVQPATTHRGGDQAAAAEWATGRLDNPEGVVVVYEAPAARVRQRLMEDPSLFRAIGYDTPMSAEDAINIEADHPIVQAYNDFEWRRTAEAASKTGKTAYRYSRAPFMQGGEAGGVLDTLGAKAKFGALPVLDATTSFVMGYDEAANFGAASRAAEAGLLDGEGGNAFGKPPEPGTVPGSVKLDVGGKNEAVGLSQGSGSTAEDLDVLREEHPGLVAAGNVMGAAPGVIKSLAKGAVGAVSKTGGEAVERGLAALEHWNPANSLWDWVSNGGKGWISKTANPVAKLGSDVLHASGGAAADQLVREGVRAGAELAGTGETSVTPQGAVDRGLDAAKHGALFGAPFALASRLGSGGRQMVEDRFPHIEEAAPHLQWGASSVVTGPRLVPETRELVREARRRKVSPVGTAAEEIAPVIAETAARGTKVARGRAAAERSNFKNTPEGTARQPASHLTRASLEDLREGHQPKPDGTHKPVDESHREAKRVFNRQAADVSLDPIDGAVELSAAEAGAFLDRRAQAKLFKDDIEAAAAGQAKKTVDRKAYLATQPQLKRGEINEEIDAAIDDLMPMDREGATISVDQRKALYKDAEQQVLKERVGTEMVLEPFGGSLSEYLKQRGKEKVYVTPEAYDATRTDRILEGLKSQKLKDAAQYDRDQFTKDGKRGGYSLDRQRQDQAVKKAEATEKAVAPDGDAFKSVVRHGFPRAGDEHDVAAMREVAGQAGPEVSEKLDKIRSLNSALDVTGRSWFAGKEGGKQGFLSLGNQADFASLRAYPVLRSLDTMGGLARGGAGRLETMGKGNDESEERRRQRDEKRAPAYKAKTAAARGGTDPKGRRDEARKARLARVRAAREKRRAGASR